jgi:hypothetical protein
MLVSRLGIPHFKMKLPPVLLALFGAVALGLPPRVNAAGIPSLFNTGVATNNANGTPATLTADGAPDAHYSIISGVDGAITPYVTVSGAYPFGIWAADTATSQWISPQMTYVGHSDPVGTYTYETTFNLGGYNLNTVVISGAVVADNAITAIRINGFSIGYSQTTSTYQLAPFTIPSGHYVSGVNTLEFDVYNAPSTGGDASGFRAQFTGYAANPLSGGYTILISATDTSASVPQGIGYATMTVGENSSVAMAGQLPDGESFSAGGILSGGNEGTEFVIDKALTYPAVTNIGSSGFLSGSLVFEKLTGSDVDGTLQWIKPQQNAGHYPAAILTNLKVIGSDYSPPTKTSGVLPGFTAGTLELSDTGTLSLSGTGYVDQAVVLSSSNVLKLTAPIMDHLTGAVTLSTGVFRGTFYYPGKIPKLTGYTGVLYQDETAGEGFFLGPDGSGTVSLTPNP